MVVTCCDSLVVNDFIAFVTLYFFCKRLQNSVYHFDTSPDASGLLIKIIWAYINDTAKTF